MDIRHICRLFSHCCHSLICWFGVVGLIVRLGLLRFPLRLSSRVRVVRSQQLDIQNGNNKWNDAIGLEIEQIKEYQVFKDFGKPVYEKNKITNVPEDTNRSEYILSLMSSIVENSKQDL